MTAPQERLPHFTPEQEVRIRAGLDLMEMPGTPHGTGALVTVNLAGEVTGLCAAGVFCAANPDLVQLVIYDEDMRERRNADAGYAMVGQRPGLARSSSLPMDFAEALGLGDRVEIAYEHLSEASALLVQQALPTFAPGRPTSLTTLNDLDRQTLPQIASVLRDLWNLPGETPPAAAAY